MMPTKPIRISPQLYWKIKKLFLEKYKGKLSFFRFADILVYLGLQRLESLPENEILQLTKARGDEN